jgi:hypothetical protein
MRNLKFTGQLYGRTVTLQQISKPTARKLYDAGEEILLCPCNMNPLGVWSQGFPVKQDQENPVSFDSVVTEFCWYNTDSERGKYPTFYKIINH